MPGLADDIFDAPIDSTPEVPSEATEAETKPVETDNESSEAPVEEPSTEDSKVTEEKEQETKPVEEKIVETAPKQKGSWKELREHKESLEKDLTSTRENLKKYQDTFGEGDEGLEIASRLFQSVTADSFDPEDALVGLNEINPDAASSLVNYIQTKVIETARANAIKDTFGRNLTEDEITHLTEYLATGGNKVSSDGIPDEYLTDDDGIPLPQKTQDLLRNTLRANEKLNKEFSSLKQTVDSSTQERTAEKVDAVSTEFIAKNFAEMDAVISDLGLDKPPDGETVEQKTAREEDVEAIIGLGMYFFGKDQAAVELNTKALKEVVKAATNKVAAAKTADYSRRLKAAFKSHTERAAKIIMRARASSASNLQKQVEQTKNRRTEISGNSGVNDTTTKQKDRSNVKDPFSDVFDDINEMARTGKISRDWGRT